ncbi:hypothetical protein GZH47_16810 [Paenibacillus rhizovicinus]|uniref:Methane oxygenase PmoA n=1 Tax=Paenibacillus rhizovicinus TaxID=2704463 RepID=A0A6C0P3A0_9BACL|nr:PmoA family protein [Paenibacillus rhizovicinus]QHW32303.1 hypothetical protein GZH47_16810 [Paenibacillus rhizovicinus]
MQTSQLRAESTETCIRIYRGNEAVPILEQHAQSDKRPYIHPILAPDGNGILTEDVPSHHPWQHGLYIGLNDVNGVGFWTEGLLNDPNDGSFRPLPLQPAVVDGCRVSWEVETLYLDPAGKPLLMELQQWRLEDQGGRYSIDFDWSLKAAVDLTFGQYAYGGLFLRMPYRRELGGQVLNSEGQINEEGEGQRARWSACCMPIEGRADQAGFAFMDHPGNAEHPVPWRVDYELGISPSRCITGPWQLAKDEVETSRYRIIVFCGSTDPDELNAGWQAFAAAN